MAERFDTHVASPGYHGNQMNKTAQNCTNTKIAENINEIHHHHYQVISGTQSPGYQNDQDQKILKQKSTWESLISKYKREDSWLIPLPWDPDVRFDPQEHYVQMDMQILDRSGRFDNGHSNELKDLFSHMPGTKNTNRPKRVLIRGDAGFGKTTLLNKFVYDWAMDINTFPNIPCESSVLVFYKLRNLREDSLLEKELERFICENCSNGSVSEDSFRKLVEGYGENFILLLDGFDELSEKHKAQVEQLLRAQPFSCFRLSSIIITTRPDVQPSFLLYFDKHFILKNLTERTTKRLAEKYFRNTNIDVSTFLKILQKRHLSNNLSPLFLMMLCYAGKHVNFDFNVESTTSEVFTRCIFLIAKLGCEREKLYVDDNHVSSSLLKLGNYFHNCLNKAQLNFNHDELKRFMGEDYHFALVCGLFRTITVKGIELLEPVHKAFMENLADFYVEQEWLSLYEAGNGRVFIEGFCLPYFLRITFFKDMNGETALHVNDLNQSNWIIKREESEEPFVFFSRHVTDKHPDFFRDYRNKLIVEFVSFELMETVLDILTRIYPEDHFGDFLKSFNFASDTSKIRIKFIIDTDSEDNPNLSQFSKHCITQIEEFKACRHPFSDLVNISKTVEVALGDSTASPKTLALVLQSLFGGEFCYKSLLSNKNVKSCIQVIVDNFGMFDIKYDAFSDQWLLRNIYDGKRVVEDLRHGCLKLFSKLDYSWEKCRSLRLEFQKK